MAGGGITEGVVEEACLGYFQALGYATMPGPMLGPGGAAEERSCWAEVVLTVRLRDAVARINPDLPAIVVDQAVARVLRAESQSAMAENERVHRLFTEGVTVDHRAADGSVRTALAWLIDWEHPEHNDWLAVNQFTVAGAKTRRPDVVVFVNGLPLGLIELKNPGAEHATVKGAWHQVHDNVADALPDSDLFPKVVVGMSEQRVGGHSERLERLNHKSHHRPSLSPSEGQAASSAR